MKPFRFSKVKMLDCPKCGTCAKPNVQFTFVSESPPAAQFLWIMCETCGYGENMKVKDD